MPPRPRLRMTRKVSQCLGPPGAGGEQEQEALREDGAASTSPLGP
jgi:hypothetical protein